VSFSAVSASCHVKRGTLSVYSDEHDSNGRQVWQMIKMWDEQDFQNCYQNTRSGLTEKLMHYCYPSLLLAHEVFWKVDAQTFPGQLNL